MEIFLLKLRPNVDMILKRVVMLNEERNQYKMKMIFISLLTVAVLAGCSETAEETPRTNSPDETTAVTQSTSDTSDSLFVTLFFHSVLQIFLFLYFWNVNSVLENFHM